MEFTRDLLFITAKSNVTTYESRSSTEKRAVHWGERKLLINEIEFLSLFWKPSELPTPQCVYIGAAPGTHIDLLAQMYPEITFHLYDPRDFAINDKNSGGPKNTIIYTGEQGFFTETTAQKWAGRNDVIMISDIRSEGMEGRNTKDFEQAIIRDMKQQEQWYRIMRPRIASLKFRLPYYTPESIKEFPYLDGYVLKGIWSPASSTETRLVPIGEFIRVWDISWYEQALAYHNQVYREATRFINFFTGSVNDAINAPELLNEFDSVAEAFVLRGYLITRNPNGNIPMEHVLRLSRYITEELNGWSSIRTTLEILRAIPGHSTVIRQLMLKDPKTRGQVKPIYQEKIKGKNRGKVINPEEEAKQELLSIE